MEFWEEDVIKRECHYIHRLTGSVAYLVYQKIIRIVTKSNTLFNSSFKADFSQIFFFKLKTNMDRGDDRKQISIIARQTIHDKDTEIGMYKTKFQKPVYFSLFH